MNRRAGRVLASVCALVAVHTITVNVLAAYAGEREQGPSDRPLGRAHAHNDYEHGRPLLDALDRGITSVEADVYLVDGRLLVAHYRRDVRPDRTLQSLYLDPLARRVRAGNGRIHPAGDRPLQLLVDIKNTGVATYLVLDRVLRAYRAMLTTYQLGLVHPGPVTVVVSGERPRDLMSSQSARLAFYDGRGGDLGSGMTAAFMPLVSDDWTDLFSWRGTGSMPARDRARLREYVRRAHANGQRVRFWATPDRPGVAREAVWRELIAAGVDYLNSDDLAGLERFLRGHTSLPDDRSVAADEIRMGDDELGQLVGV